MKKQRYSNVSVKALPFRPPYDQIDAGIRHAVEILFDAGVETFESCQGGDGHPFFEPTVRFHGGREEGFRALAVALQHGLNVSELRRYYVVIGGEPVGPSWEMTFVPAAEISAAGI